jgi:hypothetical protein
MALVLMSPDSGRDYLVFLSYTLKQMKEKMAGEKTLTDLYRIGLPGLDLQD